MSNPEQHDQKTKGGLERLADWFDSRLGLSNELLRPAPRYSINPFYWLGALAVVAFVIQGITGTIMLFYYVPTPASAYASTLYIFQYVSFGQLLETVHLYTAYAMIMLAFMHLMRGYFVSVHKKPREIMWVTGMLMGFVTLGFGFTGYLLPGTVVSKLATNVGTGLIGVLPPPVESIVSFLIVGNGSDASTLLRFYDLHVIILPAVLLVLLAVKMYMLEAHGVSEPVTGGTPIPEGKRRLLPFFPDVTIYLLELAALFGAAMLLISALFPLVLAPMYSPAVAGQYIAQPDWYFLWIYQILKISVFEQPHFTVAGVTWAVSLVSLIFVVLVLLPFIDRGDTRRITRRPIYVSLGLIFTAEVVVLSIWGHLTPGKPIPDTQAALVLGGTALLVGLVSLSAYRLLPRHSANEATAEGRVPSPPGLGRVHSARAWIAGIFVAVLGVGALSIGGSINSVVIMATYGISAAQVANLAFSLVLLAASVVGAAFLLYRLDLGRGKIKRRIKAFEVGWKE